MGTGTWGIGKGSKPEEGVGAQASGEGVGIWERGFGVGLWIGA